MTAFTGGTPAGSLTPMTVVGRHELPRVAGAVCLTPVVALTAGFAAEVAGLGAGVVGVWAAATLPASAKSSAILLIRSFKTPLGYSTGVYQVTAIPSVSVGAWQGYVSQNWLGDRG
jgi:hypothetical protein